MEIRQKIGFVLLAIVIIGTSFWISHSEQKVAERKIELIQKLAQSAKPELPNTKTKEEIVVDIEGAVNVPGVYHVSKESVMIDAIDTAGGFAATADRTRIAREMNLALPVTNYQKIYIFRHDDALVPVVTTASIEGTKSTTMSLNSTNSAASVSSGIVNVNTATVTDLDTLPGIGPAIAQRIIDWREQNGEFGSIDDLKNVSGIGESLFGKIKDHVTVR